MGSLEASSLKVWSSKKPPALHNRVVTVGTVDASSAEARPLSVDDRTLLSRRKGLLGRIMQILYGLLAVGIGTFLAKDLLGSGKVAPDTLRDAIRFGAFMAGSLALPHIILAWHERRTIDAVRLDLAGGIKHRRYGTLIELDESAESEPTRFCVLDARSGQREDYVLSSIVELSRIRPASLIGQHVVVETAPNSRVVLQLRRSAAPSAQPSRPTALPSPTNYESGIAANVKVDHRAKNVLDCVSSIKTEIG